MCTQRDLNANPCADSHTVPLRVEHAIATFCGGHGERDSDSDTINTDARSSALDIIYRHYRTTLVASAMRVLHNNADAEDAVQDLFARLPSVAHQYRGHNFGAWLRRSVVRTALMRVRHLRSKRESALEPAMIPCCYPDHGIDSPMHLDIDSLEHAVARLPISLRNVVTLRVYRDLGHRSIGEQLGITAAASEIRMCRAVRMMREMLLDVR